MVFYIAMDISHGLLQIVVQGLVFLWTLDSRRGTLLVLGFMGVVPAGECRRFLSVLAVYGCYMSGKPVNSGVV